CAPLTAVRTRRDAERCCPSGTTWPNGGGRSVRPRTQLRVLLGYDIGAPGVRPPVGVARPPLGDGPGRVRRPAPARGGQPARCTTASHSSVSAVLDSHSGSGASAARASLA